MLPEIYIEKIEKTIELVRRDPDNSSDDITKCIAELRTGADQYPGITGGLIEYINADKVRRINDKTQTYLVGEGSINRVVGIDIAFDLSLKYLDKNLEGLALEESADQAILKSAIARGDIPALKSFLESDDSERTNEKLLAQAMDAYMARAIKQYAPKDETASNEQNTQDSSVEPDDHKTLQAVLVFESSDLHKLKERAGYTAKVITPPQPEPEPADDLFPTEVLYDDSVDKDLPHLRPR